MDGRVIFSKYLVKINDFKDGVYQTIKLLILSYVVILLFY